MPRVTLITPTYGRERCLQAVYQALAAQTVADFEWLILDDSPESSAWFAKLEDPRVVYRHHKGPRLSIGAKRNMLAERASAPVIAHIDDDDYYAPDYLAAMLDGIDRGADIVKLSAWFLYSFVYKALGYWDLEVKSGLHLVWSPDPMKTINLEADAGGAAWRDLHFGFGFSYVYRKTTWQAFPFPDQSFDEDVTFVRQALAADATVHLLKDHHGLALHTLHSSNASICLPQFHLPPFLFDRLFPPAAARFLDTIVDG